MISDFTVACRALRRSPAFTLAAVSTLALGIGANTTMFSVVNAVLLRPLPGYQTGRLVEISETGRAGHSFLAPEAYLALRETLHSFVTIAANQYCRMNLTGQGEAEQLNVPCATANWFDLQRAQAMLGRTFLPDEDQHGRNRVAVLDYGYWQRRFGGDPGIVGKTLTLDKEPWLVIGVMPRDFHPLDGESPSIYTPYVVADNPHGVKVTARLKPGVRLDAAQAELNVAAARLARQNPDWIEMKLRAVPLLEQMTGPQRPLLLLLLGAVSLVLLIACVNTAGLMMARSAARRREIDTRLALGARPWHIVRFVLAETLMISLAASIAALAVAYLGLRVMRPLVGNLPRAGELSIDGRVLLYALLAGVAAALLSGLPAVRPVKATQPGSRRGQRSLVAGEVALAFVLLVGAGLLLQTFAAIRSHDLGYNPRHVLTHFLALPESADGSGTAGAALYARIRDRIAALPGVRGVATGTRIPMFGVTITLPVRLEGEPERRRDHVAFVNVVSDRYFDVMGIPLRAGRAFAAGDRRGGARVAIVSESIAKRYLASAPLGKRIVLPELKFNIDGGDDVALEIVGVAGDVCVNSVEECDAEHIYLPESQGPMRMTNLLVRTAGDPLAAAQAVRRAMSLEAPAIPLDEALTLEQRTAYLSDAPKRAMWLLGVFAGLALLLAAVGIYGVSAYVAAGRSREIGIRMALGAGAGRIALLMYREVLAPSVVGLGIGVVGAAALTRLLKSLLVGVRPGDPKTLAMAGLVLLGMAVLAGTNPALRAARSDPAKALRRD